ncbi:outer membrane protein assembly factor BamD [Parvularcula sp. LCG005]|uniref:outer membrane protein assembly factor BamD n=1 Tax=Parvularcula sp. LCG005 TaxID=3078805 RepID=UPI00294224BF|nr:outer membrane protein assembly factor BamD [Parvularcula sp. LCG005]WOI52541.1 outer membrane protein assembly factor BamD [Parvularcula sp. LCG005]
MVRHLPLLLTSALVLALGACASNGKKDSKFAYVEEPVEKLYTEGTERLSKRRYEDAIAYFEEVERQHPYSPWARRAMLMTAYSQYLMNDYEDSIASIEQFLAIHPGNKDAPYAYYLKAMNHYERIRDVGRDQDITRNALAALEDVVRRYPDSEYARDARLKLDLTRDHLAGKEMDVGRWYLKKGQHVSAINRFNVVLTSYQTTSQVPEALHRLVEAYLELGLVPEARRHAAMLGYNYPNSDWYKDTYKLFNKYGVPAESKTSTAKAELPAQTPSSAN